MIINEPAKADTCAGQPNFHSSNKGSKHFWCSTASAKSLDVLFRGIESIRFVRNVLAGQWIVDEDTMIAGTSIFAAQERNLLRSDYGLPHRSGKLE